MPETYKKAVTLMILSNNTVLASASILTLALSRARERGLNPQPHGGLNKYAYGFSMNLDAAEFLQKANGYWAKDREHAIARNNRQLLCTSRLALAEPTLSDKFLAANSLTDTDYFS